MSFNFDNITKPQTKAIHVGYTPPNKFQGTNPNIYNFSIFPDEPKQAQFQGLSGMNQNPTHGLETNSLVVNFGTYLYNQTTGTAPNQL